MAARLLLSLEGVSLSFGGKPLFEDIRLHVQEGEKACLVGKNGAGKTTLMRLITGELEPDAGARYALPGLRIGYLAQDVAAEPSQAVRDFVIGGLAAGAEPDAQGHRADRALAPLSLPADAAMGTLSGGQKRRAALARALVAEPDLLLLDEPTNHLDIAAIEWLEGFLSSYGGAYLCISHDRTFLANTSRKVYWIDRGHIRTSPKGYAHFEEWAEAQLAQEARTLENMQKKLQAEVAWTQGGVSGRRKRNQRRLNELHRLRDRLRTDKAAYLRELKTIQSDPLAPTPSSKIVAEFKQVGKSFTRDGKNTPILEEFNLTILRGDRIGVLGANGSGKSTFLKLLTGELTPDEGRIFRSKNAEFSLFDQNRSALNPDKTLRDTLCPGGGDYVMLGPKDDPKPVHVCGYLKSFLFDPRAARDRVSTLSGGQQNRLMLAKVLAHPGNVLILDEPTNDLDMDTLDMLQDILARYEGTLVLVSHDRDFLDNTVAEILAFEGDGEVRLHMGGYSDYLAETRRTAKADAPGVEMPGTKPPAPARERGRPEKKLSYKFIHEHRELPARMEALEQEIAQLRGALSDPDFYTREPEAFDAASRRLPDAQAELEQAETRWLELEDMLDGSV